MVCSLLKIKLDKDEDIVYNYRNIIDKGGYYIE